MNTKRTTYLRLVGPTFQVIAGVGFFLSSDFETRIQISMVLVVLGLIGQAAVLANWKPLSIFGVALNVCCAVGAVIASALPQSEIVYGAISAYGAQIVFAIALATLNIFAAFSIGWEIQKGTGIDRR